jgi:hypothetical protein
VRAAYQLPTQLHMQSALCLQKRHIITHCNPCCRWCHWCAVLAGRARSWQHRTPAAQCQKRCCWGRPQGRSRSSRSQQELQCMYKQQRSEHAYRPRRLFCNQAVRCSRPPWSLQAMYNQYATHQRMCCQGSWEGLLDARCTQPCLHPSSRSGPRRAQCKPLGWQWLCSSGHQRPRVAGLWMGKRSSTSAASVLPTVCEIAPFHRQAPATTHHASAAQRGAPVHGAEVGPSTALWPSCTCQAGRKQAPSLPCHPLVSRACCQACARPSFARDMYSQPSPGLALVWSCEQELAGPFCGLLQRHLLA